MRRWVLLVFLFVFAPLGQSTSPALACGYIPKDLWEKTWRYAQGFGLDPYLLAAVVWVESGYCPHARGKAGEVGLGQFMPGTWKAATGAPLEWRRNSDWALWATAKHLRTLWDSFRDWSLALAAYNAGSGAVRKWGGIPPYPVTQRYVRKVLWTYRWLKQAHR